MATPTQLSHLRSLLRSLKYMFAFATLIAIAGIIFLASVHSRVTTDVLIGMILCLCLLLLGSFFGWFALWRDPRLRFLYADRVPVRPRRTRTRSANTGILPSDIGKSHITVVYENELMLSRIGPSSSSSPSPWPCP
jgi:hypothetical protein